MLIIKFPWVTKDKLRMGTDSHTKSPIRHHSNVKEEAKDVNKKGKFIQTKKIKETYHAPNIAGGFSDPRELRRILEFPTSLDLMET